MTCGIYRITENETGRHYIGQSKNIEGRWKRHHKRFPTNLFSYHIVITCVPEDEVLDCLEKFCIADFKAKTLGFNITKGGNGTRSGVSWIGKKHSDESRRKMSSRHSGKTLSEEHRRKISERCGRPRSEETRRKMSEAAKIREQKKREERK